MEKNKNKKGKKDCEGEVKSKNVGSERMNGQHGQHDELVDGCRDSRGDQCLCFHFMAKRTELDLERV